VKISGNALKTHPEGSSAKLVHSLAIVYLIAVVDDFECH